MLGHQTLLLLLIILASCSEKKTSVAVVSALHGGHNINPDYSYEDLYALIDSLNADIIGVEIRPEDIDSSVAYLSRSYPKEMYELRDRYPSRKVIGFDWLGESIEGRPISEDYFQNLDIIRLSGELGNDSVFQLKLGRLDILAELKEEIALKGSIAEIHDGYDSLNRIYYREMASLYKDSKYEPVYDFYEDRDRNIGQNIIEVISENPGKKLVFIMGADHRSHAIDVILENFNDVELVEIN